MIDDSTMATTAEILLLADFSKQRLSQLEQAGVVKRFSKDQWPLVATIKALFADARQRSTEYSEAKTQLENIKVEREKLRLAKEAKDVVPASDLEALLMFFTGQLLPFLGSFPALVGGQDLTVRRRAEKVVFDGQTRMAAACEAEANRLLGKDKDGKAA
jgi:hypothetical protein